MKANTDMLKKLTNKELSEIPVKNLGEDYIISEEIGQGSYGRVFLGYKKDRLDEPFAIKQDKFIADDIAKENYLLLPSKIRALKKEYESIKTLKKDNQCYPYIVCYEDFFRDNNNNIYLVTEYIKGVDLDFFIKNHINELDVLYQIAYTLLETLAYIYANGYIHGDIKPANIMVRSNNSPVLIDFGLVCYYPKFNKCPISGSPLYLAPEVPITKLVTHKSDIWSLGMSFYVSMYGNPYDVQEVFGSGQIKIPNLKLKFNTSNEKFNKLLDRTLIYDSNARPTAVEILSNV